MTKEKLGAMTKAEIAAEIEAQTGEKVDPEGYKKDELVELAAGLLKLEETPAAETPAPADQGTPPAPAAETPDAESSSLPEGMVSARLSAESTYGGVVVEQKRITRKDAQIISKGEFERLKDEYGLELAE